MTMKGNLKLSSALLAGTFLMFGSVANATPKVGSATEFATATAGDDPEGIAVGALGAVWYTEQTSNNIVGALPSGKIQVAYAVPTAQAGVVGIAQGSDFAYWFTETNVGQIGRVTALGKFTEYALSAPGNVPLEIALGSDGNMWFTEFVGGVIGTIDSTGTITEYATPTGNSNPVGICAGPDGNLWFTEQGVNAAGNFNIGQITTAGVITEFDVGQNPGTQITAGRDGNLWYTDQTNNAVAKFNIKTHAVTEYALTGLNPQGIAAGADGNVWVVESDSGNVARVTMKGVVTEYALPTSDSNPVAIAPSTNAVELLEPYVFVTEANASQIARVYVSDVDPKSEK
jgi:virginiamycin B lyase